MPISVDLKMQRNGTAIFSVFFAVLWITSAAAAELTVERTDGGAVVRIDGELFAEYLTAYKHQPAIWPIIGPTGKPITRSFPLGPLLDTEKDDHPHHHSLWFAHEDVNGHNFWLEPKKNLPPETANVIKHVDFLSTESNGRQAKIVTHNHWLAGKDSLICEDQRTIVFGADEVSRWIDFTIKISATNGAVTFGDIKDGTFSTRVAGSLKADSSGTLVNSFGQKNVEAWGMPAAWIDNYGTLAGETVGLAMFSHPSNFQHPCRWHARTYGLLCANPFGDRQFPQADIKQSGYTIEAGDSLTLRYRVLLHKGDTKQAQVAKAYQVFSADAGTAQELPLVFTDDFEEGSDRWLVTDEKLPESVWSTKKAARDGEANNHVMRVSGKSKYEPPFRSPHSIAIIKDVVVGDFELTARVQNTNVHAGGHRDLCFFWGFQGPAHFYYAHLGAVPDPHSSQLFIVNGAARKMITENDSPGIPWTNGWHDVKVSFQKDSGLMQVYFDDMQNPVFTAHDKTFQWGRIGIGTFDDNGNFDNVTLRGEAIRPIPAEAKLP